MTELFSEGRDALQGYSVLKIGLSPPRDELYQRIDQRSAEMFERGLIEEVRATLARGFPTTVKPFESHGYRQAVQLLNGELTLKEAIFYTQRNTRRYAKRQLTWFRQEQGMNWFSGCGGDPEVQQAVMARVREFLSPSESSHN
jgi:tRNA dimethylallyltransferase